MQMMNVLGFFQSIHPVPENKRWNFENIDNILEGGKIWEYGVKAYLIDIHHRVCDYKTVKYIFPQSKTMRRAHMADCLIFRQGEPSTIRKKKSPEQTKLH